MFLYACVPFCKLSIMFQKKIIFTTKIPLSENKVIFLNIKCLFDKSNNTNQSTG